MTVAVLGASATALSGCGSNNSASGDGGNAGNEVTVELIAPLTGANGAYDPWVNTVKATVAAINATGEAGKHTIKLEICDAQESANTAAACGSKAVRSKAVAAITMPSNEQPYLPYLEKAGIPTLGFMVDPAMNTSPVSYSTATAGASSIQGLLGLAKKQGCKKYVLLRADPQAAAQVEQYNDNYRNAAKSIGIDFDIVNAPPGSADMSSFAAKAIGLHPDCIDAVGYGADEVSLIKAVEQSDPDQKIKLYTVTSLMSPDSIKSLGAQLNRVTGVTFAWDTTDASQKAHPGVKRFVDELKKYSSGTPQLDNNSEVMWSETHAVAKAISQVKGEVTAASVKEQLDTFHDYDPGVSPPVSFDTPGVDPVPARVFAPYGIAVKWVNGVTVTEGKFFNLYTGETVE